MAFCVRLPHDLGGALLQNCTKTVHFIRHAEAFSNAAAKVSGHGAYASWDFVDACLTKNGWQQVFELRKTMSARGIHPELVVVSPLRRALMTCAGLFSSSSPDQDLHEDPLMMVQHEEVPGKVVGMDALSAKESPVVVAHELIRERIGFHPCDRRGPISAARASFPYVDFSLIEEEEDVYWKREVREPHSDELARGLQFLQWLSQRPEREVAVVTHSSWLLNLLTHLEDYLEDERVDDDHGGGGLPGQALVKKADEVVLGTHFRNCELRTVIFK